MQLSKRQLALVAAVALAAGLGTYLAVNAGGRTYQASTLVIVPPQNGNFNSDAVTAIPQPALLPSDYVTIATSAPVLSSVLQMQGVQSPTTLQLNALHNKLTVTNGSPSSANTASDSSDSLSVAATANSASGASTLANQVTQSLVNWDSARLQGRVATLVAIARAAALGHPAPSVRNRADSMIAALKLTSVKSALSVVAQAATPTMPVAPHPLRDAVLAFLAAGLIAFGVTLYLRRAPATPADSAHTGGSARRPSLTRRTYEAESHRGQPEDDHERQNHHVALSPSTPGGALAFEGRAVPEATRRREQDDIRRAQENASEQGAELPDRHPSEDPRLGNARVAPAQEVDARPMRVHTPFFSS